MPSAANVKIDKQISSTESALAESGNAVLTPLRQAITIIEHKIRNLEKRKSKLESYRDLQTAGKELNADQKTALAKINEVIQTLDFARDLYKQFLGIASSSEKDAKKQAKREASLKNQAELARLREILLVQDALNQMGSDSVRDDFLHGRNGAAQLSENDLKLLDDLYPAVTPKHEAGNPTAFTNEVQAAAEHLLAVVDGKPKEVFGGTYSQIKEVLGKIHESGYFDQTQEPALTEENVELEVVEPLDQSDPLMEVTQELPLAGSKSLTIEATNHPALHGATTTRAPATVPAEPPTAPVPPQVSPVQVARVLDAPATVPHQTPPQEIFYQAQPPQPQPPRPITEMLGSGSFFFLQESEIDTPEQISTQTFTNQSFVVQPPPPIPMPPHFQPQPIPPGSLPPTVNQQVPPAGAPIVAQQGTPLPPTNEDVSISKPIQPQNVDDIDKHSVGRGLPPHQQNRNPAQNSQHQQQSYYNNGYNNNRPNRPAQQHSRNNGVHQGRPQTNRH